MNDFSATVALGQLQPGPDLDENLAAIARLAETAAAAGASALLLPEYACFLHGSRQEMTRAAQRSGEVICQIGRMAARHSLWVLLGSIAVPGPADKLLNRCLLFDAEGRTFAQYDKLHLFDATLPDGREIFESRGYVPGDEAVVVSTPFGMLGLSVCYDLRFPQLYRALAHAGAEVIVVPSAFARQTGAAHWQALLQARAIECGAWVLAPATCGSSPGNRDTHGHSMAIDPWGRVVGDLGEAPGCLVVRIDAKNVQDARRRLPTLQHDRPFAVRHTAGPHAPPRILSTWSPSHHVER